MLKNIIKKISAVRNCFIRWFSLTIFFVFLFWFKTKLAVQIESMEIRSSTVSKITVLKPLQTNAQKGGLLIKKMQKMQFYSHDPGTTNRAPTDRKPKNLHPFDIAKINKQTKQDWMLRTQSMLRIDWQTNFGYTAAILCYSQPKSLSFKLKILWLIKKDTIVKKLALRLSHPSRSRT